MDSGEDEATEDENEDNGSEQDDHNINSQLSIQTDDRDGLNLTLSSHLRCAASTLNLIASKDIGNKTI